MAFSKVLETDPPPIIIKSGSLIIESDQPLTPPPPRQNQYFRRGFGKIRKIRVFHYNEITGEVGAARDFQEGSDWDASDEIQVNIDLQSQHWNKSFSIIQNSNDIEFQTPINLSPAMGKGHSRRNSKREDEGTDNFTFGLIRITKRGNGEEVGRFDPVSGRDYIIGLYPRS